MCSSDLVPADLAETLHVNRISTERVHPTGAKQPRWRRNLDRQLLRFDRTASCLDQPHFSLQYVRRNAQKASLQDGDTLLAIDGARSSDPWRCPRGRASRGPDESDGAFNGSECRLGRTDSECVARVLGAAGFSRRGAVIMPALCLVPGFWVAAVRPRHVRAGWRKRSDEPALQRGGRGPQRVDKGGCEGCGREGEEGLPAASCLGAMGAGGRCAVMPNKPLLTAWRARECLPPNRSEPLVVC